jgi:hypothetical protein
MDMIALLSNRRWRPIVSALSVGVVLWSGGVAARQEPAHQMGGHKQPPQPGTEPARQMGAQICGDPTLACAVSATPTFAPDGSLWLIWAGSGRVSVARSNDHGRTFAAPALITPKSARLDDGPDERPQIVADRKGHVVVSYAIFKDDRYNGQVLFASSADGGSTFSAPRSITDAGSSQRFVSLSLDPSGDIFASWIDKRHVAAAQKAGQSFPGASLAFAWSADGGATFQDTHIAHDNMCECCRLAIALAGPHRPAVLFRNIFNGERDHAVMTFADPSTPGPINRVSADHWKIDVCPHHGPSLAIADDGGYHAAWFSGGGVRQGVFYAHSADRGRTFSEPMAMGSAAHHPTRPYVVTIGRDVWLAWKEFDGERTTVSVEHSRDGGATWSAARTVAQTLDFSDHPLLVSDGKQAYISWLTHNEGYRLLPLEPGL